MTASNDVPKEPATDGNPTKVALCAPPAATHRRIAIALSKALVMRATLELRGQPANDM